MLLIFFVMSYLVFAVQIFKFPQPEKAMLAVYAVFAIIFLIGLAGKNLPTFLGVSDSKQVSIKAVEVSSESTEIQIDLTEE